MTFFGVTVHGHVNFLETNQNMEP